MTRGVPANRHGSCHRCGNAFELRGPLQKYCASCEPIMYSEKMRLYSANYYRRYPERVKLANKR
jgi:ribosomal protein L37E